MIGVLAPRSRSRSDDPEASGWRAVGPQLFAAVALVLTVALIAFPFWPGRMDADTLNEIGDAMSNTYTDEHAPILEWIWHLVIHHGIGPGWVLTGQLLMVVISLYILLRLVARPVPASLIVFVICLSPPVYGQLGKVGRDVWFLSLLLAAFACATRYLGDSSRWRWAWLLGTVGFAWLTQASRQNAAFAIVILLALPAAPILRSRWPRLAAHRWWLALFALLAGLVVTLAIVGTQKLADHAIRVQPVYRTADLFVYDLARLSREEHRNLFPASVVPDRALAPIEQHSSEESMVGMLVGAGHPVPFPYTVQEYDELRSAWEHAIEHHPAAYLDDRLWDFLGETSISHSSVYAYHLVIDANPWGYHSTFPGADRIANDYEKPFINSVTTNGKFLYAVWAYLLACIVAVILWVRRATERRIVFGTLALSALTYQISLAFLLMGNDYRFEFPSVVIGEVVTAAGLCVVVQRLRDSRRERVGSETAEQPPRLGETVTAQRP